MRFMNCHPFSYHPSPITAYFLRQTHTITRADGFNHPLNIYMPVSYISRKRHVRD